MGDRHILKRLRDAAATVTEGGVAKLERTIYSDATVLNKHATDARKDTKAQDRLLQQVRTDMVYAQNEVEKLKDPINKLLTEYEAAVLRGDERGVELAEKAFTAIEPRYVKAVDRMAKAEQLFEEMLVETKQVREDNSRTIETSQDLVKEIERSKNTLKQLEGRTGLGNDANDARVRELKEAQERRLAAITAMKDSIRDGSQPRELDALDDTTSAALRELTARRGGSTMEESMSRVLEAMRNNPSRQAPRQLEAKPVDRPALNAGASATQDAAPEAPEAADAAAEPAASEPAAPEAGKPAAPKAPAAPAPEAPGVE